MVAHIPKSRAEAEALDRADLLAGVRAKFLLPDGVIYLDGHSLGPATHAALAGVEHAARQEWAQGLIRSWNGFGADPGWIDLPARVGARLARLIGAEPDEVIVCDSVSVNLFKLAVAALPLARAPVLLVEEDEFPTDQYIADGVARLTGVGLERVASGQGGDALERSGGVLIKSVVNYRTARVADMTEHEAAARGGGGLMVWDLSHSAGVIDASLSRAGARLATGCTYKYLNGGPGSPGYIYARRDIVPQLTSPLSGWMGHAEPFAFVAGYAPRADVGRFAAGTPGILSLSALSHALDAFGEADPGDVAAKARALGDLCLARASGMGLKSISPADPGQRGGHVSLLHAEGYAIVQALAARGVIADFRAPDTMRFGFAPLYLRHADVWDGMDHLQHVIETRAWDTPAFRRRAAVT